MQSGFSASFPYLPYSAYPPYPRLDSLPHRSALVYHPPDMITLTSLGSGSFKVSGTPKPLIVFPKDAEKASGDNVIVLSSTPQEQSKEMVLSWPGEYNVSEISFKGIGHLEGKQVSYTADCDGVRCAFLSSPLQDWTDKQMEFVGDVDVLVLPTNDAKLVQKLVDEFDPRVLVLIPGEDKAAHAAVMKSFGAKETVSEYKLKGSMPQEGREVIVLAGE